MIARAVKKEFAKAIKAMGDDLLAYAAEEIDRERKRRRLEVRARRAAKRKEAAQIVVGT